MLSNNYGHAGLHSNRGKIIFLDATSEDLFKEHNGTERLSGLGLLNVYREKELDPDRIVDIFANKQNRRLALLFRDEHYNQ